MTLSLKNNWSQNVNLIRAGSGRSERSFIPQAYCRRTDGSSMHSSGHQAAGKLWCTGQEFLEHANAIDRPGRVPMCEELAFTLVDLSVRNLEGNRLVRLRRKKQILPLLVRCLNALLIRRHEPMPWLQPILNFCAPVHIPSPVGSTDDMLCFVRKIAYLDSRFGRADCAA
eukprot:SAG11_NODE_1028_length_6123_cov_1.537517_2_plen_170_part_00